MDNPFDAVRSAVGEAKMLHRAVKEQVDSMIELIDGNLRNASPYRLKRLKRELHDFNAHTGGWKK